MMSNWKIILMGIIVALSSIASTYLIGMAVNSYSANGETNILIVVLSCAFILATPCLRTISNIYTQKMSSATKKTLKQRLIKKLVIDSHRKDSTYGEIIDLVDGDVEGAIYLYHNIHLDITLNISIMILSLYIIYSYSPIMALAPFAAILYAIIFHLLSRKSTQNLYSPYVERNTNFISSIGESMEQKPRPSFELHLTQCTKVRKSSVIACGKLSSFEFCAGLSYLIGIFLLFTIGSSSIVDGTLSIGDLISSTIYIERVLSPTIALISVYYATSEALYRKTRITKTLKGGHYG